MNINPPLVEWITTLANTTRDQPADVVVAMLHTFLGDNPIATIAAQSYAVFSNNVELTRSLLFVTSENLKHIPPALDFSLDWMVALALLLSDIPRDAGSEVNALAILEDLVARDLKLENQYIGAIAKVWFSCCTSLLNKGGKAVHELIAEHVLQQPIFLTFLQQAHAKDLWNAARVAIEKIEDIELRASILDSVDSDPRIIANIVDRANFAELAVKDLADLLSRATELLVDFRRKSLPHDEGAVGLLADGLAGLVSRLPSFIGLETGAAFQSLTLKTFKRNRAITPTIAVIGGVLEQIEGLIKAAVDFLFGDAAPGFSLVPCGARTGSYIMDVQLDAKYGSQAIIFAVLHLLEQDGPLTAEMGEAYGLLLNTLAEDNTSLSMRSTKVEPSRVPSITLDIPQIVERRETLRRYTDAHLLSADVPQADDLERVIKYVRLFVEEGVVDADALGVTGRQVAYYAHAARVLRLVDQHQPLSAGRQLIRLEEDDERLRFLAVCFESSKCGLAWLNWSNAKDLRKVEPNSAETFLIETTHDLSTSTIHRRAQTLESWSTQLKQHHYTGLRKI